MTSRANPKCGPCCKTKSGKCQTVCEHCLPRYLCLKADISLAGDTGTGTSTSTSTGSGVVTLPCCKRLAGRMLPSSNCGWEISGLSCSDGSGALGYIHVEVVNDTIPVTGTGTVVNPITGTGTGTDVAGKKCYTKVTGAQLEHPLYFDGIVHNIAFSIIQAGLEFDIVISRANMVGNPLAFDKCSPCACVTCLPGEICIRLVTAKGTGKGDAVWNCETRSWDSSPITIGGGTTGTGSGTTTGTGSGDSETYNFSLDLARVEDKVGCSIILHTTGTGTDDQRIISLESTSSYTPDVSGVVCVEGDSSVTRGDGNLAVRNCFTVINTSFQLFKTVGDATGTGTHQELVGTVTISDKSCGQDCNPDCQQPPMQTKCCTLPIPSVLHASATYRCDPACGDAPSHAICTYDASLFLGLGGWSVAFNMCGQVWSVRFACFNTSFCDFGATADGCGFAGYGAGILSCSCDPFQVVFGWSWTAKCCPDGSFGDSFIVTITH